MLAIGLVRELGRMGVLVGRHPLLSILFGVLLTIPSLLGFLWVQFDLEMNGGFVPASALSHQEIADQQSFFSVKGLPFYMALFGFTDGNLLEDETFNELNIFYETTMNMNLTIDGKEQYQFKQLCHPLCKINIQLQKLMEINFFADMKYPVSNAMGYYVNIGKHVFNRTVVKGQLVGAKLVAFYYTSLITNKISQLKLENFAHHVTDLAQEHNQNTSNRVRLTVHGTSTAGAEIQRGFIDTMKLTIGSVVVVSLLFLLFILFSSWMYSKLSCKRLLFCLTTLALPPFALASGCGLLCLIGVKINMLFILAPIGILVFVSHLQNVFLLISKFDSLEQEAKHNQYTRSEMMAETFEKIASTSAICNLSLIFGFGIARFFLSSSYGDYSLGAAFCLLYLWVLELLILGPLLAFECAPDGATVKFYEKPQSRKRSSFVYMLTVNCTKYIVQPYSLIIGSIPGRIFGIILLLLFAGFPIQWGLRNMRSSMDFRRFLPLNSPANQGFDVVDIIWKDFHQIVFIINKPSNFSDYGEYMEFRKFVSDIQAIPNALNTTDHMSWIFDYFNSELNIDFFSEKAALKAPNMSMFHSFITTFPYEAWSDGIKFEFVDKAKKMPKINRMVVIAAFNNVYGLEGKRKLIHACRQVTSKNLQLQVSAFDTDSRTVDIIDNVLPIFFRWSLILLIAVVLVPLVTLWNIAASLLSFLGCAYFLSSSYALIGLLDIPLDLMSMTMLVTVAAIGIRISLYFVGEFLLVWVLDDRIMCAIQNSAGNVLKTSLMAFVLVAGLMFVGTVPLFVQYALMTSLILGVALISSLFVLPLGADFLPTRMISL